MTIGMVIVELAFSILAAIILIVSFCNLIKGRTGESCLYGALLVMVVMVGTLIVDAMTMATETRTQEKYVNDEVCNKVDTIRNVTSLKVDTIIVKTNENIDTFYTVKYKK